MYSLWHGGKYLGHFEEKRPVLHHGRRVGAMGILETDEDLDPDCAMMQTRFMTVPGSPTFQHPLPIEWIGKPAETRTSENHGPVALKPMSPEAARGIAQDKVYEIRDEAGERVDVQLVTLRFCRFAHAAAAKPWRDANFIQGEAEKFWMVSFASAPMSESK